MSVTHRVIPTAEKSTRMSTFFGGLAAWLGGVAFCFGFGITGPTWVAAVLTVLSVAAVGVSRAVARRTR